MKKEQLEVGMVLISKGYLLVQIVKLGDDAFYYTIRGNTNTYPLKDSYDNLKDYVLK